MVKNVMAEPLDETEILCKEVITVLSSPHMQGESLTMMRSRVESLLPKILESKKKMMLKSPKGKELSGEALRNALKLHGLVTNSQGGPLDDISTQIRLLEASIEKIEIYWKSFEYVAT